MRKKYNSLFDNYRKLGPWMRVILQDKRKICLKRHYRAYQRIAGTGQKQEDREWNSAFQNTSNWEFWIRGSKRDGLPTKRPWESTRQVRRLPNDSQSSKIPVSKTNKKVVNIGKPRHAQWFTHFSSHPYLQPPLNNHFILIPDLKTKALTYQKPRENALWMALQLQLRS
jgi:hypothetical protein